MAVVVVKGGTWDYSGLSTDSKPTGDIPDMATFWEYDTKKAFVYSRENINPDTGNGWWSV